MADDDAAFGTALDAAPLAVVEAEGVVEALSDGVVEALSVEVAVGLTPAVSDDEAVELEPVSDTEAAADGVVLEAAGVEDALDDSGV
jgi:hypothetical protein